jgi:hypothetical protein
MCVQGKVKDLVDEGTHATLKYIVIYMNRSLIELVELCCYLYE